MKKKLLLLLVLTIGFIIFTVISVVVFKKEHEPELKVLSSPTATVMLDGKNIGKTPLDSVTVTAGEHMIRLTPEGSSTDTVSWQGKITAYPNSRTYVDRELGSSDVNSSGVIFSVHKSDKPFSRKGVGAIEITTDPIGTIIYLDNDEKGIAPLALQDVGVGEHEISAYSPGFIRRSQKVVVEDGYVVVGEIKLAIDPSYQKVEDHKEATESAQLSGTPAPTSAEKTTPTPTSKAQANTIKIKDTPTGFLRVRAKPSTSAEELAQVDPGDTFEILDEENGWIKIEYKKGEEGWIAGQYAERM